jgi:predicted nucleotidyltransferase
MDINEIISPLNAYTQKVSEEFSPEQIILYGSYAKGTAQANSDIDVAVIMREIPGDFLDLASRLYKLCRTIDDRIEPVLLESRNDQSGFLSDIRRQGIVLYPKAV